MSEIRTVTDRIIRQLYGDGCMEMVVLQSEKKFWLECVQELVLPASVQGLSGLF